MSRRSLTPIVLPADPAAAMEAATKQYVDLAAGGTHVVDPVEPASPVDGLIWTNPLDDGASDDPGITPFPMIEFGGNDNTGTVGASFATVVTATFTKPASWVSYKIMAWGFIAGLVYNLVDGEQSIGAKVTIDGDDGIQTGVTMGNQTGVTAETAYMQSGSVTARHLRIGLTANAIVQLQATKFAAGPLNLSYNASINYLAVRTT